MIVMMANEGWDVIHQPAHALLASKLAMHWSHHERSSFFPELLMAIAQHDNQQRGLDGDIYLTASGAPKGFTVSKGESDIDSLEQPREVIHQACYQGQYLALLTAMHVQTLYAAKRQSSKALDKFLAEVKNLQKQWRKSLGLSVKDAKADYALMLWCDRCSLILCQDEIPSAGRRLEVQRGPRGTQHFLFQREDKSLGVEDWPFQEEEFTVNVEVHHLKGLRFESKTVLREALREAKVLFKTWTFRKS
ncbi:MAG: DUF3891 family protein [Trueperaceae bacterium]